VEKEIFRTRPDRPWGPPSLLYNGYRVSFPVAKRPGRGVDHPPPSSAEVKERVELYLYSTSGPSWPVLVWTLLLPLLYVLSLFASLCYFLIIHLMLFNILRMFVFLFCTFAFYFVYSVIKYCSCFCIQLSLSYSVQVYRPLLPDGNPTVTNIKYHTQFCQIGQSNVPSPKTLTGIWLHTQEEIGLKLSINFHSNFTIGPSHPLLYTEFKLHTRNSSISCCATKTSYQRNTEFSVALKP
jgi:hypothetical protein